MIRFVRVVVAAVLVIGSTVGGVASVAAKADRPTPGVVVACVSKASSTLRISADKSCSYGSEFKLVWSARGAAPALCVNGASREMTLAYVGGCPLKGTRLAKPKNSNEILGCADKDTGVLRWPRTGVCWWENTPVKWFAVPTQGALPAGTGASSSTTTATVPTATTVVPRGNFGSSDTTTTSTTTTTTTVPDTTAPTVTLARTAPASASASIGFTVTGNEALTCSTLSLTSGSDFDLTNISTITSITQTSPTVCTIVAESTAITNGVGVVSILNASASFSVTDTAGNAQTTLVSSPQSVTVTRNGEPDAPVISSVTAGNAQVTVAWGAPANNGAAISDYVVQYSTSPSGSYTTFADGTSTNTTATITGLTNGAAYYFKTAAINSVGTGSFSVASAASTPILPTQTVTWAPTTALTTTQSPNTPLAASSSGDGVISYAISDAGTTGCAIDSSTRQLTFSAAGSCVVRATAATTSTYLTGFVDVTFTVTALTCATGGSCTVGVSRGAGGGIVFYYSSTPFTSTGSDCGTNCHYLEASWWDLSPGIVWATSVSTCYNDFVGTNANNCQLNSIYSGDSGVQSANRIAARGIGKGMENTNQIYFRLTTAGSVATWSYAAGIAWDFTQNGKSDWFLPSRDELAALYREKARVGGFESASYWSSSEISDNQAYFHNFFQGNGDYYIKSSTYRMRPVRAG